MLGRLAGTLITGPLAFLVAGLYDVCAFFVAFARQSLTTRVRRARDRGGRGAGE